MNLAAGQAVDFTRPSGRAGTYPHAVVGASCRNRKGWKRRPSRVLRRPVPGGIERSARPAGEERHDLRMQRSVAAGEDLPAFVTGSAGPVGHRAAGRLDDRNQRLNVVGLERCLDHDVDQAHREQAVRVAVAAPAGEARACSRPGRTQRGRLRSRTSSDRCTRRRLQRRTRSGGRQASAARCPGATPPAHRPSQQRIRRHRADERRRRRCARRREARSASPSASGRG